MSETGKQRFVRVRLSKDNVRKIYARLSRIYDFWGFLTESTAIKKALHLADIKDGESVLEVAVGTGKVFEQIVSMNKTGRNDGIDLSPEMLSVARKRLNGRYSNYALKVADAYSLPYDNNTFDVVINNYMFDLLPEQDFSKVLLEIKRVLKTKGRVVVTSMTPGRTWYSHIWDWLVKKAPNILEGCRPISLAEDFKYCGFENIQEEYISQLTFPSLVIYAVKP